MGNSRVVRHAEINMAAFTVMIPLWHLDILERVAAERGIMVEALVATLAEEAALNESTIAERIKRP